MRSPTGSIAWQYAGAALFTVLAVLLRWLLDPWLGDHRPLVTLYGAVALSVWYGGYRPALLVTVVGYLACSWLFIEPRGHFLLDNVQDVIGLFAFLISCGIIIGFGEAMRVAQQRARAKQSELQQESIARKQSEERLRQSEERYRSLVSILADVPWLADPAGELVGPHPEHYKFTDTTEEQNRGEGWANNIHPDDRERVKELWRRAVEAGTRYESRGRIWHAASQSYHYYVARAIPVRNEDGSIRQWVGAVTDVHEQKLAEEALREEQRRFRAVFNQQFQFMAILAPDGTVLEANDTCFRATGVARERALGHLFWEAPWWDGLPAMQERWKRSIAEALRTGGPVADEVDYLMADGSVRHATVVVTGLKDDAGHISTLIVEGQDDTDRKRGEEWLRQADRRKNEFLAMLGHELRNPLAPLRNAIAVLQRQRLEGAALEWACAVLDRQVRHLTRLVEDLLDVSRISHGHIELRREPVSLAEMAKHAAEMASPAVEAKGHDLSLSLPSGPLEVEGDPTRLTQVIFNLLHNAAKYTSQGGNIWLAVERDGDQAVVRVRDNGMGMKVDLVPHVFDLFTQGERTLDRSQGGLGVGLTLVKRLVEMHGGTVEAKCEGPDKGSEFIVRLPALQSEAEKPRPACAGGAPSADVVEAGEPEEEAPLPREVRRIPLR
jgi:PAS domain S-box-containing protein